MMKSKMSLIVLGLFFSGAVAHAEEAVSTKELQRQIDLLGQEVQKLKIGGAAEALADQKQYGLGPAASKVYRAQSGFSLGGYGEILFESFRGGLNSDGTVQGDRRFAPGSSFDASQGRNRIDLKRVILYAGYKFNDEWVMNSELEWEHGGSELAVEFLYFDRFVSKEWNIRFGKVLMPVGLQNEVHEPTTYLGTHRTRVESLILPTTWSEYGAGVFGDVGDWTYRSFILTGMNASGFTALDGIREGRNETGFANATRFAWVGRMDYVGKPGWLAGGSLYFGSGTTQPVAGQEIVSVPMKLLELHLQGAYGPWEFQALVAYDQLGSVEKLNTLKGWTGKNSIGSEQGGAYAQLGYECIKRATDGASLVPFIRYELINTQMAVPVSFSKDPLSRFDVITAGINYKPISQVVLKGDYDRFVIQDGKGVDQLNLSVGYVF